MKMKMIFFLGILVMGAGCRRENESSKVIDGLPVNTVQTAVPAEAAQQFHLLNRDALSSLIPIVHGLYLSGQAHPGVFGPDSQSRYNFNLIEKHYGTATLTFQFRDISNAVIDPIAVFASTALVKSVAITCQGTSPQFTYVENLVLTIDTAGSVDTTKLLTGTALFSGSGISMTFTFNGAGSMAVVGGLNNGSVSAVSNVVGQPVSLTLNFNTDHDANGTLAWDDLTGSLHIGSNGSCDVVTRQFRIILD